MKKLKIAVNQCFISTISDYTIPFINYYNKWNTGNVVNGHEYQHWSSWYNLSVLICLFKLVIKYIPEFFLSKVIFMQHPQNEWYINVYDIVFIQMYSIAVLGNFRIYKKLRWIAASAVVCIDHSCSMGFTKPSGMADTYAIGICTDRLCCSYSIRPVCQYIADCFCLLLGYHFGLNKYPLPYLQFICLYIVSITNLWEGWKWNEGAYSIFETKTVIMSFLVWICWKN